MVEPSETIFEEREELMFSPFGGKSNLRIAHFLRPLVSIAEPLPKLSLPSPPVVPITSSASRVQFKGWQRPQKKWRTWIESLHSKYHSVWKKGGIYEAIMGSKYHFHKHTDLVVALAEKWRLLGFGRLCFMPYTEMVDFANELLEARKVAASRNALIASHYSWLNHFMGSGGELEHLAFLSLWLSKFVFPSNSNYLIEKRVFNTAIRLAKGTRLALAPAVLSSIYGELGLLNQKLLDSTRLQKDEEVLNMFAPFQLVQLWAWERFPVLRPNPNPISNGEPRSARWHKLKYVNFDQNIRSAIECAGECFQWRPYAMAVKNWLPPKFYQDKEQWVSVDSSLDKELESFVRCLRVSMLVGLDYIQEYLPHRVAMQFGMDQDIPACVPIIKLRMPNLHGKAIIVVEAISIGKEEDDLAFPPGSSQKCYQIEVNRADNNVSVSPGFSQEYQKLEVKASSEGNENYVSGSLGKPNKEENTSDFGFNSLSASKCQNVSGLVSADNPAYNMDLVMKPAAKMMQRIGTIAGQENAVSDTIESEEGHLTSTRVSIGDLNGINSRFSTLKMLEVDLEARISRLEGALDELKAERLAHKFDKKTAKDGVYDM
ncbi:hypothetical protein FNV43_RR03933 [Rhamnella rubrinervis]|uniref:Aminotransferase-like plant mobile domain-containing protein n=1 Tax=Rhamnella rubrinervis TaxID=2594499 RepID=A0A8K0HKX5_9ROSA|nr:hypothetical protein FNV43_RR03933 [Rhamnella rubrinervis]